MRMLSAEEIGRLSPEERLALIGELWDSLRDEDVPLSGAQRAELKRRLTTFDQDRAHAVTWEQLRSEIAQRLRK
jgi:putative addiction module component (TIGR02574 family)